MRMYYIFYSYPTTIVYNSELTIFFLVNFFFYCLFLQRKKEDIKNGYVLFTCMDKVFNKSELILLIILNEFSFLMSINDFNVLILKSRSVYILNNNIKMSVIRFLKYLSSLEFVVSLNDNYIF